MRILCGTDFTPNSKAAADVAAALAARVGDALSLVHVVDEYGVYATTGGVPEEMLDAAEKALDAEAERLKSGKLEVNAELMHGSPDVMINQEIREKGDCSMVVVSSLGHRAPERWLLGSVSARLAESAAVPTLILRDGNEMIEWLEGNRTLKILVCFDGSVTSEAALRWATTLTTAGKCEIVVAYVNWPVSEQVRLGISGPLAFTENQAAVQEVLERDFSAHVKRVAGDVPVRIRIEPNFGRVDASLIEIAIEESADLVVVGTHQRRGLERLWRGSVSRGVLLRAPSSVAIVPVRPDECVSIPAIQRVVVAIGFDDTSRCTVAQACSIAPVGSILHLVTVVHPYSLPGPIGHYQPDRVTKKEQEQEIARLRVALRGLVPPDAKDRGLEVVAEVVEHEQPAVAIVQAAERANADVVCVGASSGGVLGKLLGSVAQSVVKDCGRPVFVAKPPAH